MTRTKKPMTRTKQPPPKKRLSPFNTHPGRPNAYDTPEQMQAMIEEYFESCWTTREKHFFDEDGNKVIEQEPVRIRPYTISGLAAFLGIARCTLLEYQKDRPTFTATIVKAKAYIEGFAEEQLYVGKGSANGIMFSMKNNFKEWSDTTRKEVTGLNGEPLAVTNIPHDERAKKTREELIASLGEEVTE